MSATALFTKIEPPAVSTSSRRQGTFTVIGVGVRVGAQINASSPASDHPKESFGMLNWSLQLERNLIHLSRLHS